MRITIYGDTKGDEVIDAGASFECNMLSDVFALLNLANKYGFCVVVDCSEDEEVGE